jgi:hypothetical protein
MTMMIRCTNKKWTWQFDNMARKFWKIYFILHWHYFFKSHKCSMISFFKMSFISQFSISYIPFLNCWNVSTQPISTTSSLKHDIKFKVDSSSRIILFMMIQTTLNTSKGIIQGIDLIFFSPFIPCIGAN